MVDWVCTVVMLVLGMADWFIASARMPHTARRLTSYSWRVSVLPLALGAILGRVVAPDLGPPADELWYMVAAFVGLAVSLWVFHFVLEKWLDIPNWFSVIYIPCGIPPGMLLWPVG